jgi:hypothetical protein
VSIHSAVVGVSPPIALDQCIAASATVLSSLALSLCTLHIPTCRSHSHQQLTDPLAVVAAAAGMDMSSPQEGYALQRYGSNPHTDLMSVHQQQQRGGGSGGGGAGAAAAVGSRAPSGPVNMPSFSAGMGGVRRMTGVNRVDSDASQVRITVAMGSALWVMLILVSIQRVVVIVAYVHVTKSNVRRIRWGRGLRSLMLDKCLSLAMPLCTSLLQIHQSACD